MQGSLDCVVQKTHSELFSAPKQAQLIGSFSVLVGEIWGKLLPSPTKVVHEGQHVFSQVEQLAFEVAVK